MKYRKTLSAAILIPVLFLSGCGLDGWFANSSNSKQERRVDNFEETEIGKVLWRTFPNKSEEEVRDLISNKIGNDYSEQNLRKAVIKIGMKCQENQPVCRYEDYVITQASNGKVKFPKVKHLYTASINTHIGITSFHMNKELIELDE